MPRATDATPRKKPEETPKERFLRLFAEFGVVATAAKGAGVSRQTPYKWADEDEAFKLAWDQAKEHAADLLEAEVRRRGHKGVLEPVYYKGKKVGAIRRYSDTLLIFLLKAMRPEKYRERFDHAHSAPGGGPIQHAHHHDLTRATTEELRQLESILAKTALAGGGPEGAGGTQS